MIQYNQLAEMLNQEPLRKEIKIFHLKYGHCNNLNPRTIIVDIDNPQPTLKWIMIIEKEVFIV